LRVILAATNAADGWIRARGESKWRVSGLSARDLERNPRRRNFWRCELKTVKCVIQTHNAQLKNMVQGGEMDLGAAPDGE